MAGDHIRAVPQNQPPPRCILAQRVQTGLVVHIPYAGQGQLLDGFPVDPAGDILRPRSGTLRNTTGLSCFNVLCQQGRRLASTAPIHEDDLSLIDWHLPSPLAPLDEALFMWQLHIMFEHLAEHRRQVLSVPLNHRLTLRLNLPLTLALTPTLALNLTQP